ncbi:MAG: hypothetical protein RBU30_13130, partial [Polyangia bacterium]|nr:hypothetical protein [Polyangia bacterium]
MIPGGAARPPHSNYDGGSGQGRARAKLSGVRLAFANLALVGLALIGAGPGLGLACCAACCAAVCGAGCGAKPADYSPVGVVNRLVAALDDREQGAAFELLGPETRARLKAAAARANALGGGKPRLVPKEMLSLA